MSIFLDKYDQFALHGVDKSHRYVRGFRRLTHQRERARHDGVEYPARENRRQSSPTFRAARRRDVEVRRRSKFGCNDVVYPIVGGFS